MSIDLLSEAECFLFRGRISIRKSLNNLDLSTPKNLNIAELFLEDIRIYALISKEDYCSSELVRCVKSVVVTFKSLNSISYHDVRDEFVEIVISNSFDQGTKNTTLWVHPVDFEKIKNISNILWDEPQKVAV